MFMNTISLLALVGAAQAHMSMFYPPPLGGAPSVNKLSTATDKQFNYPLGCCGADGPSKPSPGICRGHLDKFDTEEAQVTWQAGQDAHFQLTDFSYDPNAPGSTHNGGSCQVGFSVDKGKTWKVAASYHGACPKHTEDGSPEAQTFDFKVPTGMPEGDALFAWIWLNREHESFMNCAKVKIGSGGSSTPADPANPAQSSSVAQKPAQSSTAPQTPVKSQSPTTPQQPAKSSVKPTKPTATSGTGSNRPRPSPRPQLPVDEEDEETDEDSGSHRHWDERSHPEVQAGARRYDVDGASCICRRGELNSRCACDGPSEKRAATEKKALRMHRRTLYKRVDSCNWASAPAMEVSYYTSDAKCAPNAKTLTPSSDSFELSWDVSCGVVEGDGTYPIKMMQCGMYGA
ncbi:hypothetical protein CC86DRAFT_369285 [Ophiobolus disseminans]|uniref:Lytic polysaccharide monooxygenase n=1 Tax=Ophiobolus disseminans TaxID=1469910 RepID=A0A6A7A4C2_9PLEO|nr:hypothetical protein CC86DRAFT_369285 [Ophiobolus disseminans]